MEQNSKELAEAGSFGLRLHFHPRRAMTGAELGQALGKELVNNARPLAMGGSLLGHIKAVAKTEAGFVKVSVVDLTLGPEMDTDIADEKVERGTLNIMAAVAGHTDNEVRSAMESVVAGLSDHLELEKEKKDTGTRQMLDLG